MMQVPTSVPSNITRIILDDRRIVGYRPKLNALTGSMSATILLGQIMYWAEHNGNPFYKFMQPCGHKNYRVGDSWCEELGITRHEYDGAIRRIGQKISRGISPAADALVWYWTDMNRLTWYQVNWDLVNARIAEVYSVMPESGNTYCQNPATGIAGKRQPEMPESGFTYMEQRVTPENTQRTSSSGPASAPLQDDDDDLLRELIELGLDRDLAGQVMERNARCVVQQKLVDLVKAMQAGKVGNLKGYALKVFGGELYSAKQVAEIVRKEAKGKKGENRMNPADQPAEASVPEEPLPHYTEKDLQKFGKSLRGGSWQSMWEARGLESMMMRILFRDYINTENHK